MRVDIRLWRRHAETIVSPADLIRTETRGTCLCMKWPTLTFESGHRRKTHRKDVRSYCACGIPCSKRLCRGCFLLTQVVPYFHSDVELSCQFRQLECQMDTIRCPRHSQLFVFFFLTTLSVSRHTVSLAPPLHRARSIPASIRVVPCRSSQI